MSSQDRIRGRSRTPPRAASSESSHPVPNNGPSLFEVAVEYLVQYAPLFEKQASLRNLPPNLGESVLQHALRERKLNNHTFRTLISMGLGTLSRLDFSSSSSLRSNSLQALSKVPDGQFSCLTHLSFSTCLSLTDLMLNRVISQSHRLQSLDINSCTLLTTPTLALIPVYCPKIRSLNVNHITNFNDQCLQSLGTHAHSLEALFARDIGTVTFVGLSTLLHGCASSIQILDLADRVGYNDTDVSYLVMNTPMPNLEIMRIGCKIPPEQLPQLVVSFPKLKEWMHPDTSSPVTLAANNVGQELTNISFCGVLPENEGDLDPSLVLHFANVKRMKGCCLRVQYAQELVHAFGPQLHVLKISCDDSDDERDSFAQSFAELDLPSLEHFSFDLRDPSSSLTAHKHIFGAMPNLKKLQIFHAHQQLISDAIEMLPKLEKLVLGSFRTVPRPPLRPLRRPQLEVNEEVEAPPFVTASTAAAARLFEDEQIFANADLLDRHHQPQPARDETEEEMDEADLEEENDPHQTPRPRYPGEVDTGLKQMITINAPHLKKLSVYGTNRILGLKFQNCVSLSKLEIESFYSRHDVIADFDGIELENTLLSIATGARHVEILSFSLQVKNEFRDKISRALAALVKALPRVRCFSPTIHIYDEVQAENLRFSDSQRYMYETFGPFCAHYDSEFDRIASGRSKWKRLSRPPYVETAEEIARGALDEGNSHLMAEAIGESQMSRTLVKLETSASFFHSMAMFLQREPGSGGPGPKYPGVTVMPLRPSGWRRTHSLDALVSLTAEGFDLKEIWITSKEFPCLAELTLSRLYNLERVHIDCPSIQSISLRQIGLNCKEFYVSEKCSSVSSLKLADCHSIAQMNTWLKSLAETNCSARELIIDFWTLAMKSERRNATMFADVPMNNKQLCVSGLNHLQRLKVTGLCSAHDRLLVTRCPQLIHITTCNLQSRLGLNNISMLEEIAVQNASSEANLGQSIIDSIVMPSARTSRSRSSSPILSRSSYPSASSASSLPSLESIFVSSSSPAEPESIFSPSSSSSCSSPLALSSPAKGKEPEITTSSFAATLRSFASEACVEAERFAPIADACPNLETIIVNLDTTRPKGDNTYDPMAESDSERTQRHVSTLVASLTPLRRLKLVKIRQNKAQNQSEFLSCMPHRIGDLVCIARPTQTWYPVVFILPPEDRAEEMYAKADEQDRERLEQGNQ